MTREQLRMRSKFVLLKQLLIDLRKWEEAKHPRDQQGRFATSPARAAEREKRIAENKAWLERYSGRFGTIARKAANRLGFDPNKMKIEALAPGERVRDSLRTAGTFDPKTGEVAIYYGTAEPHAMRRTIAHEVNHAMVNYYDKSLVAAGKGMHPSHSIFSRAAHMVRHYKLLSGDLRFMAKWGGHDKMMARLEKDDGVTDYSRGYWKEVGKIPTEEQKPASGSSLDIMLAGMRVGANEARRGQLRNLAIHETLAEMAAEKVRTGTLPGSEVWKDYYGLVENHWKRRKKRT